MSGGTSMSRGRDRPRPAIKILIVGFVATVLANIALEGLNVGGSWQIAMLSLGAALLGGVWILLVYGPPRIALPKTVSASRWLLPPVDDPVDRPALTGALSSLLLRKDASVVGVTTALVGAGGFGKTTLAIQVCSRDDVRARFPGGLFWATIGQERTDSELAAIVNDVAEQMDGARSQFSSPEQAGRHLGQLLNRRGACLLVIDDVWTPDQLAPFTVGGVHTTRFVTTRI